MGSNPIRSKEVFMELAHKWFEFMRGKEIIYLSMRPHRVVELIGYNEFGVWYNDEFGSTHLRSWDKVKEDMGVR
jgi:hypothetical protein